MQSALASAASLLALLATAAMGLALHCVELSLALAVLAGAVAGGWKARRWRWQWPRARAVLRCLAGGWLLGLSSRLVPGGNDSLVLVGLPLLWPHAWASVVVMCAVIAAVFAAQRWCLQRRGQPGGNTQP